MNTMHREEIENRRIAFDRCWRNRFATPVSRLPANVQGEVHDLLKAAFKAGSAHERRKQEPVRVGGVD